ncbi:hypothetical protein E4K64_33740 [Bradyrhizobium frederickii]|uniref:Peptidase C39-like domain-containing protein n=1 Tax=Bradyrhizobium frederickii TaxID=2560054 RepID=A0A4Y9NQA8_9BRAD|nr:hypothetical protein [Bradyrhizobium frederickii]TFV69196.1 hypothetical protein E4K64_33740 [Bradyrhizobium frederickii]
MPLYDVTDWVQGTFCVPTALAAITGKKIPDVMEAINKQAEILGIGPFTQSEGIPPKCWLEALPSLGISRRFDEFHKGLTIEELFEKSTTLSPILVLTSHRELGEGHVFAAYNGYVVDTYTGGKVTPFSEVPEAIKGFRVVTEIY